MANQSALLDELRAIEAEFESKAPWSEGALYSGIRHVQRNTDVMQASLELEEGDARNHNLPGRYDGTPLAKLRNALPRIIAALEAA
jgi:hypothetical protein